MLNHTRSKIRCRWTEVEQWLTPRCWFKFLLAVTFLMLIDRPVQAEWVALGNWYQSHPLQVVYVDPSTIRRDGNVVTFSALIDWKTMQGGRTPTRFYSTTLTKQVDCMGKLLRTISSRDYYGHMGTGDVISTGKHARGDLWVPVEAGTTNQGLWETVCGKE